MVEFLFSCGCYGAGYVGAGGDLPPGAAPRWPLAQRPAGCDGRDATVVAGGCTGWSLRSPRSFQPRIRRAYCDVWDFAPEAAFRGGYFSWPRHGPGTGG